MRQTHNDRGKIPWAEPWLDKRETRAVLEVLRSNWLSMGERTSMLERKWANLLGAKFAVAVANGTLALEIALASLDIGPGDEVAVPAMTYIATVTAVLKRGATPVFVDIERNTFNIDPDDLSEKMSPKTKAIIYIDYGGIPANAEAILKVARQKGAVVLQDAAQTIGASRNGKLLGFETGLSVTSFHASKLVTTIEGGMIFTDQPDLDRRFRVLRNQGEDPNRKYHHIEIGFNAKLTDLQAAIGLVQLRKLSITRSKRRLLAANYSRLLSTHSEIELVSEGRRGYQFGWYFYPVLVKNRDAVETGLRKKGIDTRSAFPMPVYRQECIGRAMAIPPDPKCPVAEAVTSRILTLPMYHTLRKHQQERVVRELLNELS